jgi:hypothetical protein
VNALRKLHRALVPGGVLIDTQPVSRYPPVWTADGELGTLDMSEWVQTIAELDALVNETLANGLFTSVSESRLEVTDRFDAGQDFMEEAPDWAGTRIDPELAARIAIQELPLWVRQEVRLRVLRRGRVASSR